MPDVERLLKEALERRANEEIARAANIDLEKERGKIRYRSLWRRAVRASLLGSSIATIATKLKERSMNVPRRARLAAAFAALFVLGLLLSPYLHEFISTLMSPPPQIQGYSLEKVSVGPFALYGPAFDPSSPSLASKAPGGKSMLTLRSAPEEESGLIAEDLSRPTDSLLDPSGTLYIAESGKGRVLRITPGGRAEVLAQGFDPRGDLYLAFIQGELFVAEKIDSKAIVYRIVLSSGGD